jgi:ribosomal protein L34E
MEQKWTNGVLVSGFIGCETDYPSNCGRVHPMIWFFDTMPKRTVAKEIQKKSQEHKCLVCGEVAFVRGVCKRHYEVFKYEKRKRPGKQAKAEFESDCIREGLILSPWQVCELTRENPFSRE